MTVLDFEFEGCGEEGPQSALEKNLIRSYLEEKGYKPEDLKQLPQEEARQLMLEACRYASFKLAEVESRAHMRHEIRAPD